MIGLLIAIYFMIALLVFAIRLRMALEEKAFEEVCYDSRYADRLMGLEHLPEDNHSVHAESRRLTYIALCAPAWPILLLVGIAAFVKSIVLDVGWLLAR